MYALNEPLQIFTKIQVSIKLMLPTYGRLMYVNILFQSSKCFSIEFHFDNEVTEIRFAVFVKVFNWSIVVVVKAHVQDWFW